MDRIWKMTLLIVTIILGDQFSKGAIQSNFRIGEIYEVIPGMFNLTYVKNTGVAFSFGAHYPDWVRMILFKVLPIIACFYFLYLIWESRHKSFRQCLAFSLIFAGAVGNIIDRVTLDYVVDMFDFYQGTWHFATFNVADSAISIAAGILILDWFLELKNGKPEDEVSSTVDKA